MTVDAAASGLSSGVSCILPAFNEAESLPATVAEWTAALARFVPEHEVVVVDDGSTDDTAAVLRDLVERHDRVRVVTHPRNLGYGTAIMNGFTHATFPLLFFTDADGQYEPEDLPRVLEHIRRSDVVVGYRSRRADPLGRSLLSFGYNTLVRRLLGVSLRDVNCAFKILHRDALRRLALKATGFGINAELADRAAREAMTIVEVPVRHRPRRAGRSSVRPFHAFAALDAIARVRFRRADASPATRGSACAGSPLPPGLDGTATPRHPAA